MYLCDVDKSMNRRSFLKRMAGAGALIATADLPSFAEEGPLHGPYEGKDPNGKSGQAPDASVGTSKDSQDVFPQRGAHERLSLSYATVEIGLEHPFSILHISDSHLCEAYEHEGERQIKEMTKRTKTFGGKQEEALRDALAWARDNVEYVLHTGDLIDWQSEANFDLIRKYFGEGFFGTIGNHEYKDITRKYEASEAYKDPTRKLLQERFPADTLFQAQQIHGVNFITMDDVFGTVTEEQVDLFKKEVKKGLPIVLCLHVPIITDKIYRENRRFWTGKGPLESGAVPPAKGDYKKQKEDPVTSSFINYLKSEPQLKCILSGHMHITTEDQFSPTCREYVVAGGFLFNGREVLFV